MRCFRELSTRASVTAVVSPWSLSCPVSQLPQLAASGFLVPIMVTTPLDWKLQAPAGLCPRREVHDVGLCSFPAS